MARYQPPASVLAEQNAGQRFGLVALGLLMSWGLADVWRTPILIADQGGLTFLVLYAVLVGILALPVIAAEISLGRMARQPAPQSLALGFTGQARAFYWVGLLAFVCVVVLAVVYAVVGSRLLQYAWLSTTGQLEATTPHTALAPLSPEADALWPRMGWLALVVGPLWLVASRQRRDVMRVTGLLVPLLLLLALVQLVNVSQHAGLEGGMALLLAWESSSVTLPMFKAAGEQALMTLGGGLTVYLVIGVYSRRRFAVGRSLLLWGAGDLLWLVLAGLLVLSLAFADGLPPEAGGMLVFGQVPYFLSAWPLAGFYTSAFYTWLVLMVLGTLLALTEPLVHWVSHAGVSRRVAALVVHALLWLLAVVYLKLEARDPESVAAGLRGVAYLLLPLPMALIAGMTGYIRNYESFCAGLGWSPESWKARLMFRTLRYLSFPLIVIILALMILSWSESPCWLEADQASACLAEQDSGATVGE
ncbi:MAG: hypothetical protein D6758_00425 [Gammaproteobacteria bacterium]|nr:MAG: hypothetical protein D6758_00425 [Gammaproteobacteria bacterium]